MTAPFSATAVETVYQQLLDAWNRRNAADMAALFAEESHVVGFDGSLLNGRSEIETVLGQIFQDHVTAVYLGLVREVRLLAPDVALLRAVVGMVPPGQTDINPALNAIQSLVAVQRDGRWQITLYQNTPAQFHGRPDLAEQLSQELRQLLAAQG